MAFDGPDETNSVIDNLCVDLEAAIRDLDEKRVRELLDSIKQRDNKNGLRTLEGEVGYNMLRDAIQKHRNIAKLLIEHGVNANRSTNQACNTPLHLAIKNGDWVLVEMLLNRGAKTRAKNSQGKTPLYLAVEYNHDKIIETLLEKDNEPNLNTKNKLFPIDAAAKNGNEKIFNLLVSKGAKSNIKQCDGTVMLDVAVEKGYTSTVDQILKHKNSETNKNLKNNKLITVAVMGNETGHKMIAKTLFSAKFPLDPESIHNVEFIHKVVETGQTDIFDELLKLGADPNTFSSSGDALLITACKSQQAEIVKILIKNNASVRVKDINGCSVLYYAIDNLHTSNYKWRFYNSVSDDSDCEDEKFADDKIKCFSDDWFEITKLLIDKGADIKCRDKSGNTPLQYAILQGCLEVVKLLLQQDSASDDTKTLNDKKQTLLHSAASIKSRSIIKLLLKRKYFENVDIEDIDGKTPLHLAVQSSRLKTVKLLLKHKANVNAVDKKLSTPLLCAIHNPYQSPMIELLLEHKADPNCVNKEGLTPSFIAATYTNDDYIQILLKYGADLNLKIGDSGKTALHCLAECENKFVNKIIKYGADINVLSNDEKTALDYLLESMVSYCKKNNVEINPLRSFMHIEYYTNKYRENAQILIEHILKLKSINSYVSEKNLLLAYKYELDYGWINDRETTYRGGKKSKIDEFQKKCEEEIELMKQLTIYNTNINFYQILTKCTHRLAKYVLNDNVNQQLRESNHTEKFPIYCDLIKIRFEKCLERKKILNQDTDYSFQRVLPSLPYDCIDQILSYLNNKDLEVLISVCYLSTDSHVSVSDTNNSNGSNVTKTLKKQKI
ncbi:ankyrin-1-like isoform X2 [Microplitis mediator]|uniref:ankyrin-1-like isoform X2 n=1 Tax=Microplitis mediator TaxID=375433 RepID=UPI0025525037|nr:ankyrin-1-like isoform X2 [Microplitis mediator]